MNMASLYGKLRGNRGETTRLGSKDSGIHAQLQTWGGAVRVRLEHDGECVVEVGHPTAGRWRTVWDGNVDAEGAETRPTPGSAERSAAHR
jgi:hypothetical protein